MRHAASLCPDGAEFPLFIECERFSVSFADRWTSLSFPSSRLTHLLPVRFREDSFKDFFFEIRPSPT
jgi:hypothetical protein